MNVPIWVGEKNSMKTTIALPNWQMDKYGILVSKLKVVNPKPMISVSHLYNT